MHCVRPLPAQMPPWRLTISILHSAKQRLNSALGTELVHPYACDIGDVEALRSMFQRFVNISGRLDIATTNAGITNYGRS
jgi:NAD(P)-dependent dehydrogenase (short-subunit alcohol dehydrogenase family)